LARLFDNRGSGPRADPHRALSIFPFAEITARLIDAPFFVAGLFVERDEEGSLAGTDVEDAQILVDNGRRGVAPNVVLLA